MFYKQLIFIFFLNIQLYYGQQPASVWYDTDKGLPQNSVKDIIKDKYGFIWISTENGLVRYDGNNFVTYNHLKFKNNRFTSFLGNAKKDTIYNTTAYNENIALISKRNVSILSHKLGCLQRVIRESRSNFIFTKNAIPEPFENTDFLFILIRKTIITCCTMEQFNIKITKLQR